MSLHEKGDQTRALNHNSDFSARFRVDFPNSQTFANFTSEICRRGLLAFREQAEKEFYTGIIKARKEAILDYSADLLSREKGIVILTKEFKRMPDRSLASKDISSTEAAKKLAEAKNSRASKDETLNKLNIKAVEDSHLDDSSDTSCL